jgi:sterol desaturase/sphingolipid hydroxylase (fatty acid hydroxylase superfamily)
MKLEDLLSLAIPVAFFAFWGLEMAVGAAGGGRAYPEVRGWSWVGLVFFVATAAVNASAPLWLPPEWIARHRLMDLTALGLWGAPIAYLAISLAMYGFHRAEHRVDLLWRTLHQTHHGAERVDMPGWVIAHPLEMVVQTALITGLTTFVLGLDPVAATLAATTGLILTMFAHVNIRTPRWLGYVLVRPEQHALHHERGVHARNYGNDVALWDRLFGTYRNPATFEGEVGFGRPSVRAIPAMLAFADVSGPRVTDQ